MKAYDKSSGHLIDLVEPGSPADLARIKPGWRLLRIDNREIADIIEYRIATADEQVNLLLLDEQGFLRRTRLDLPSGISPGLRFNPVTMDKMKRCANRCLFCFIDQNPAGLRDTLYVKDDDYRLSFLYGNFITLNRLKEDELKRIIKLQLSPLYVSIHTTDRKKRKILCGTELAGRGLDNFCKLASAGIKFHVQVVLCPGYNTGETLIKTISDLEIKGDSILSLALVPVGLTAHRGGLVDLRGFTAAEAENLIDFVSLQQQSNLRKRKSRFIFLADEFYNMAGKPFPEEIEYEGYPQLENGVGLARRFLEELSELENLEKLSLPQEKRITLITGRSAYPLLKPLKEKLDKIGNLSVDLLAADNYFFGKQVTVAGLLTGGDLLQALKNKCKGEALFISSSLLKERSDLFLDNMSLPDLEERLGLQVFAVEGPQELVKKIRELFMPE